MKDPMYDPVPIFTIDQIDLDSHGIIEASAGTGKTYTIENLVVSLLKSGKVFNLEEILVVTYTEKAAGELKDRIRQNIKAELKKHKSEILQMSLDNFDSASIFTIHGFCNKILQEYAFENGEQFQSQLVDDRAVYQQALYNSMREIWPNRYGKKLQKVLRISQYPGTTGNGMSSWENRTIDIAIRFQPSGNDILIPDSGLDLLKIIHETEIQCKAYLDELEQLVGTIDKQDISNSDFPARYATLNINKNSIGKRLRMIGSILELLVAHPSRKFELNEIHDFFSSLKLEEHGFYEFAGGWKKEGPNYEEKLPHLLEIIEILEKLRTLDLKSIQNILTAATVDDIKRYADEQKKVKGLISYDDMITRVYSALDSEPSILKKVLQKRYRYALVDEFQDTDMLQWKIFSAIFLDAGTNRLFIIGDPKQSIYGFRGADVHAYYIARDEMAKNFNARYYCLNENWRSSPDLITSYNTLFAGKNWFSDSNIHYLPNHYPKEKTPDAHKDDKSLLVMDCGTCSGSEAKYRSANYIAREAKQIVQAYPTINLNEIAILVTKWKEAEIIEKSLKNEHIKYSYYKKEGLYQSKEVLELSFLIAAIANPHDMLARKKALVTRFFRIPVQHLFHYTGTIHDQPASLLFERWINFAGQKNWSLLFQSFMEDSGILYLSTMEDHDRAIINYRSVLQNLEIEAYRNNFCIQDITDYLNSLRMKNSLSHDNYNIQAIDLDKPGIQILTIHASKGLQFKVVFIAGGFTKKITPEFWTYHNNNCRLFDLVRNPGNKAHYDLEIASEDERLFYVALTRARDRLYIPVFEPNTRSKSTAGILGDKLPAALNLLRHEKQVTWVDIHTIEDLDTAFSQDSLELTDDIILPDPLFPDTSTNYINRRIFIDSFSGLKTKLYHHESVDQINNQFGNPGSHSHEDEASFTITGTSPWGQAVLPDLPRGKETGIMLHTILEQINFQHAGNSKSPGDLIAQGTESCTIINKAIQCHMYWYNTMDIETIRNQIAQIIWNTLNSPLNGLDLFLKNQHKRIHEVEFYYPSSLASSRQVPETTYKDGFMHGFIDMIFLFNNKYYILDWKSNYIEEGYSQAHLKKNICDMHYDLQISIYSSAVIRWLKNIIQDYHYEIHFGGVYYLYLRGMDSNHPKNGIYFYRSDDDREMENPLCMQKQIQ